MQTSLAKVIENLKASAQVVGIFTTGSSSSKLQFYSDIDLVIILKRNSEKIKSIYTILDQQFADIFFFDIAFLNNVKLKNNLLANNFEGIFVTWLSKSVIHYDPIGVLEKYKKIFLRKKMLIADSEKQECLVKINYSYIVNKRYYSAKNRVYSRALQLRLAYSVIELSTAYCAFREIPWRGEKDFISYLEKNDKKYLKALLNYFESENLKTKYLAYTRLFDITTTKKYKKWENNFLVINAPKILEPNKAGKIKKMFR